MTLEAQRLPECTYENVEFVCKFLMLGDSGVGKTCYVHQYLHGCFLNKFTSTIGMDFGEKFIVHHPVAPNGVRATKGQRIHLQLWDTAGQERFRSLTTAFFRDAMGFLLVFDLTHEQSFVNIRNWLSQLQTHAYCENPDIVLLGNKADLQDSRAVDSNEARNIAESLGLQYFETSAATGQNVNEAIEALLDQVMRRMEACVDTDLLPSSFINNNRNSTRLREVDEANDESGCGC
ncbi:ras-related protein Rab-27A-like isoform X1 [Xenia sp. Carnegie-2017]|uniref:ras-related protein Rab-27A-like isoform X1 n=1 Tax=Xenia sp. Carnegie-2017 TaxID=2897299 RepID=UPI001F0435DD|nr:ras-related protein Rab-27A-like isoform X1 [Xenia sp. Carnegie-2017]